LSSTVGPFSGSTESDPGIIPIPTLGLVYHLEDSKWTVGLGVFGVGGLGVNYPASTTNPILAPPAAGGLGALYSKYELLELTPVISCQITDHLSIGVGPIVSVAQLQADPAFFDVPNTVAPLTYPSATHGRETWGLGVQAGIFFSTDSAWHFGASVKSPQWQENFTWNAMTAAGTPRTVVFRLDFPLIASVGVAYSGIERLLLAADVRYIDYHNTDGYRTTGFDATAKLMGLGWSSVVAAAAGAQFQATEKLALRVGYTYNMNPIDPANSMYNVLSPTVMQHTVATGGSYRLTDHWLVSAAFAYALPNAIQGPIITPAGPIPGSSVRNEASGFLAIFGSTVRF
jgi:long-chain fatty acid transport protein